MEKGGRERCGVGPQTPSLFTLRDDLRTYKDFSDREEIPNETDSGR
jgi:hypothetical protein